MYETCEHQRQDSQSLELEGPGKNHANHSIKVDTEAASVRRQS